MQHRLKLFYILRAGRQDFCTLLFQSRGHKMKHPIRRVHWRYWGPGALGFIQSIHLTYNDLVESQLRFDLYQSFWPHSSLEVGHTQPLASVALRCPGQFARWVWSLLSQSVL